MKILLKIFPQKSHLNATFTIARALKSRGHQIVYLGVEELRAYVEAQGYQYHSQQSDFIPYKEPKKGDPKLCYSSMLRNWNSSRRWIRANRAKLLGCSGFDSVLLEIKPDLVLVDSPYTFHALGLFRHKLPFVLIESMLNLNRAKGFPPQDTTFVPRNGILSCLYSRVHWLRYFLKRRMIAIIGSRPDFDQRLVKRAAVLAGIAPRSVSFNRYFHMGLSTVPEIILSPREIDFPTTPAPNQFYVGPSVDMDRTEMGSDYSFESRFSRIVNAKRAGRPLVYCSLGTGSWRYNGAETFLARVIRASEGARWNLIMAVGTEIDLSFFPKTPANVNLFHVVPQLRVLRETDLMVTHGGMNSITECILSAVPMLVVPGTSQIDQAGNAARVSFHCIGRTGSLKGDSVARIRSNIDHLLGSSLYRERIEIMRGSIRASEAYNKGVDILLESIKQFFPAFRLLEQSNSRISEPV
jgi:UDP:flavonoid glycosyltransferase YjiC (YdhE family)